MKRWKNRIAAALLPALLLSLCGCAMTVDQMYVPPRRSEAYNNLQSVMDDVMGSMEYSAPLTGENQQTVQMADLTGDGVQEVILFAKGSSEKPLQIVVFQRHDEEYSVLTTIESTGTAFEQVEYVQMDGQPGLEMVVGRQVSDQVLRNVSVYRISDSGQEQLMNANYRYFLTCDLDQNGRKDLLVICPGRTETDNAIAELFTVEKDGVQRSAESVLSRPVTHLKRTATGGLHGGKAAVFVASVVDESAIITDVFALIDGVLTNVSFSNESGTSVSTLSNYYVYADDIDGDGEIELPSLVDMLSPNPMERSVREQLIRWYAMAPDGSEVDKLYTYHNFLQGWYMELGPESAERICVVPEEGGSYSFCLWSRDGSQLMKMWSVYILTGDERSAEAVENDRFVLLKTDTVVYAGRLEEGALEYGVTREQLIESFHLIQSDWKTGEM